MSRGAVFHGGGWGVVMGNEIVTVISKYEGLGIRHFISFIL